LLTIDDENPQRLCPPDVSDHETANRIEVSYVESHMGVLMSARDCLSHLEELQSLMRSKPEDWEGRSENLLLALLRTVRECADSARCVVTNAAILLDFIDACPTQFLLHVYALESIEKATRHAGPLAIGVYEHLLHLFRKKHEPMEFVFALVNAAPKDVTPIPVIVTVVIETEGGYDRNLIRNFPETLPEERFTEYTEQLVSCIIQGLQHAITPEIRVGAAELARDLLRDYGLLCGFLPAETFKHGVLTPKNCGIFQKAELADRDDAPRTAEPE